MTNGVLKFHIGGMEGEVSVGDQRSERGVPMVQIIPKCLQRHFQPFIGFYELTNIPLNGTLPVAYPGGRVLALYHYKNGNKQGWCSDFSQAGTLLEKSLFMEGQLEGEQYVFNPNTGQSVKSHFRMDELQLREKYNVSEILVERFIPYQLYQSYNHEGLLMRSITSSDDRFHNIDYDSLGGIKSSGYTAQLQGNDTVSDWRWYNLKGELIRTEEGPKILEPYYDEPREIFESFQPSIASRKGYPRGGTEALAQNMQNDIAFKRKERGEVNLIVKMDRKGKIQDVVFKNKHDKIAESTVYQMVEMVNAHLYEPSLLANIQAESTFLVKILVR
jgi:antitoxin component YwqK of YwqJK toxin-antitoxin module